jgi:hypothetical protein
MAVMRAGWMSFVRLHGVRLEEGPAVIVPFDLRGPVKFACDDFRIVLEHELTMPVNLSAANFIAIEGGPNPPPRQMTALRSDDPQGSWLEVVVSRDFEVDETLARHFIESGGKSVAEVDAIIGAEVNKELRDVGILASALSVIRFESSQPHLRNEARVYWWSDQNYTRLVTGRVRLIVVPQIVIKDSELASLPIKAAKFLVQPTDDKKRDRRSLALVGNWLLAVSDLPLYSNERFIVYFQALEALASCTDSSPDPELSRQFDLLEQLTSKAADADRNSIWSLLKRIKGPALNPSLRERFRRLAEQHNPDGAADDIAAFRAITKLRNDLVHASVIDVPAEYDGYDVERTLRRLAFFYFDRVASAHTATHSVSVTNSDTEPTS